MSETIIILSLLAVPGSILRVMIFSRGWPHHLQSSTDVKFFLGRGPYVLQQMLIFISPQEMHRAPSADRLETLPRDRYLRRNYNASPKIRGPPLKNLPSVKFGSILHNFRLWSRISPERVKISKIGKTFLWSRTILPAAFGGRSPVNFGSLSRYPKSRTCTHPSRLFSGDYISAFRGCWPLKFLHALEFDQGLLTHTTNRVAHLPSPQKFLRANI